MAETRILDTVETFFGYPISTFSTAQAVKDGVLVPLDRFRGKNNVATWQVWGELAGRIEGKTFDSIDRLDDWVIWYACREVLFRDSKWEGHDRLSQKMMAMEDEVRTVARNRDNNAPSRIVDVRRVDRFGRSRMWRR